MQGAAFAPTLGLPRASVRDGTKHAWASNGITPRSQFDMHRRFQALAQSATRASSACAAALAA
eukprot:15458967-Alexandrium_andersonii.AAC.1